MDKRRIELIIAVVASLIFIILLINALTKLKRAPSPIPTMPETAVQRAEPALVKPADIERKDLTWGRDPFVLGEVKSEKKGPTRLVLNGIIWDEKNPYAIINDEVVAKGDTIDGNTVIEVRRDSVILDSGTEQFTLKMWQ